MNPFGVLHGDEVAVDDAIGVEGPDDIGVIQPAHELHLALESGKRPFARDVSRIEDFQRDDATHHSVTGLVDLAHRALTEEIEDDVAPEDQGL